MKKLFFLFIATCLTCTWACAQELQAQPQEQSAATAQQPTRLQGRVVIEGSNTPLAGATVTLGVQNISTVSNQTGEFSLTYLEHGDEEIIIEADGFQPAIELINLLPNRLNDLGVISMQQDIAKEAQEEILMNLAETELNDDEGKSQEQGASFSASQDVFNNTTSFAWSNARYRNRGYLQTYEQNYINGLSFNSAERGQFNFSAMGGLNDASRNKDVINNIEANDFTFGGLGKATNYLMNASRFAQGWKVGLAGTNRNYKAAVRATYATGMLPSGWAFVGQLAYRFSPYIDNKGIIGEGIRYNSFGFFFAGEKVWENGNRLNLVVFGAPTERGQSGAVTQEVYDLTGSINYNPYWGYQNGEVRNSRIVHSFDPTAIATFDWKINNDNLLKFGLGYHYSWYSNSALQFFNAPNPAPDYYRNMPSFLWDGQIVAANSDQLYDMKGNNPTGAHYPYGNFIGADLNGYPMGSGHVGNDGQVLGPSIDVNTYNALVNLWQTRDNQATQINWDLLYMSNLANNHNDPSASARYIQERRHNDIHEGIANINYTNTQFRNLKITAGLDARLSQGVHFKTIDDLLGGNQLIDVDPFADRDIKELATNTGLTQEDIKYVRMNDVATDYNTVKHLGDRFGYDYRINMTTARLWAQNEWSFNEVDFYYGLQFTYSSMQRTTDMVNGRAWYQASQIHPAQADLYLGPAAATILAQQQAGTLRAGTRWIGYRHDFVDPAFKLGATYKINGRNRIKINAIAQTTAPLARNAYLSARVHDRVLDNIYTHDRAANLVDYFAASEKSVGGDLTYEFNYPLVRGRITGFFTQFWNGSEMNGYYDDEARTFVNQAISGINHRHMGIEAAAAVKLGSYFTLTGAVNVGDYRYTSNALAVTTAENGMELGRKDGEVLPYFEVRDSVYMNGLHVATGPQISTSLKLSFFYKMWFADLTVSYYDWNYLSVAPSRRMMGLYKGTRTDGTYINGGYYNILVNNEETSAIMTDENGQTVYDAYGTPKLIYPYNIIADQETLTSPNVWNRFLIDASVGKLIYLPKRQSLSINLTVNNITNNTHFKTGGYQQSRLPRQSKQGELVSDGSGNAVSKITPNAWKFPSKYYYAWGVNFYLSLTYKF
ncbi:MAG: carboxypeptidase-like regulatory domain-containing protein [Paludibacteraceae bacterium]|nr:carboxypeptidase-like regulatory domain-containing protein [Paludibacteraceae bacterium]